MLGPVSITIDSRTLHHVIVPCQNKPEYTAAFSFIPGSIVMHPRLALHLRLVLQLSISSLKKKEKKKKRTSPVIDTALAKSETREK